MREIATVHAEPQQVTDSPVYRVNFWSQPPRGFGWPLDAYALVDARDVHEVIEWAEERAEGRKVEIFVEVDEEPDGLEADAMTLGRDTARTMARSWRRRASSAATDAFQSARDAIAVTSSVSQW